MATRSSGKKVAAGITTVVALGSFSVAGIAAVAVDLATPSHAATSISSTGQDDGTSQEQGRDNGYYNGNSGGSSVQQGNGGNTSGRSSGS